MIRKTLLAVAAIGLMTLSGCDLYFGPTDGGDVVEPTPDPGDVISEPGGECFTDANCAAGCDCQLDLQTGEGICVETGFCDSALDCAAGYTCDARGTCVAPDQALPGQTCASDDECAQGCFCDGASDDALGECVETGICSADDDCFGGMICDEDRGTCVNIDPTPECSDLTTEEACIAAGGCGAIYRGIDCTSQDGSPCTSGEANCECAQFIFDSCDVSQ